MKIREIKKKWKDAVIYDCVCADGSTTMVDQVVEKEGKIYFRQVYPEHWKAFPIQIIGHTGTELAKKAYKELQDELKKMQKYKEGAFSPVKGGGERR